MTSIPHSAILKQLRRRVDLDEYKTIRQLWMDHSIAEDARDIPGLMATLTEDCVYTVQTTGRAGMAKRAQHSSIKNCLQHFPIFISTCRTLSSVRRVSLRRHTSRAHIDPSGWICLHPMASQFSLMSFYCFHGIPANGCLMANGSTSSISVYTSQDAGRETLAQLDNPRQLLIHLYDLRGYFLPRIILGILSGLPAHLLVQSLIIQQPR